MAHNHNHTLTQNRDDSNRTRLLAAFAVTALFMVVEVIGGLVSGSLALLADAGHMLADTAALLMALMALQFAKRKAGGRHTFGLLRLTTLAAFVNAIALLIITLMIVWEAIVRFSHPEPVKGGLMMVIAISGLLANLLSFWLLHRGGAEKNLNVRAAALHVLGDLLGSVGALIAALIIIFTGWTVADPFLSILVSVLVVRSGWALLKESLNELLEASPQALDTQQLALTLTQSIPEVRDVHHVHLWQVGEKPIITLHVKVVPPNDHDALLQRIHHFLRQHYQIEHATVQMEFQRCDTGDCRLTQTLTEEDHSPHHH